MQIVFFAVYIAITILLFIGYFLTQNKTLGITSGLLLILAGLLILTSGIDIQTGTTTVQNGTGSFFQFENGTSINVFDLIVTNSSQHNGPETYDGEVTFNAPVTFNSDIMGLSQALAYAFIHAEPMNLITIGSIDTFVNITEDMTMEQNNTLTFSGGGIIVNKTAVYKVSHTEALSSGNNKIFELDVGINGTETETCEALRKMGSAGDVGSSSGVCLLEITAPKNVTIMIKNLSDATDVNVQQVSLVLTEV